jgi:hypothetical protein
MYGAAAAMRGSSRRGQYSRAGAAGALASPHFLAALFHLARTRVSRLLLCTARCCPVLRRLPVVSVFGDEVVAIR